ncbi:hypothetical protein B0T25DRAFT_553028 [Lasiosphaeria hispida]|uniref:Uncharacterized protein n=1 Tax=Lasiosphaeria hispida TaxID=260671 RepID=A0AAJ0HC42_9PEZI|nr:hypothetical protein B0T25DRAFT_553028 [Lasiosphaeria hispida]
MCCFGSISRCPRSHDLSSTQSQARALLVSATSFDCQPRQLVSQPQEPQQGQVRLHSLSKAFGRCTSRGNMKGSDFGRSEFPIRQQSPSAKAKTGQSQSCGGPFPGAGVVHLGTLGEALDEIGGCSLATSSVSADGSCTWQEKMRRETMVGRYRARRVSMLRSDQIWSWETGAWIQASFEGAPLVGGQGSTYVQVQITCEGWCPSLLMPPKIATRASQIRATRTALSRFKL